MENGLALQILKDYGPFILFLFVLAAIAYRAVSQGVKVSVEVKPKK